MKVLKFKVNFIIMLILIANLNVGCSSNNLMKSGSQEVKKDIINFRITWKAYSGRGEAIQKIVNSYNIVSKDEDAIQIVHKIKSSSGNIGAKRLFAVASELQKALVNEDGTEIFRFQEEFQVAFSELFDEIVLKIPNT